LSLRANPASEQDERGNLSRTKRDFVMCFLDISLSLKDCFARHKSAMMRGGWRTRNDKSRFLKSGEELVRMTAVSSCNEV
jgi:hypothetical protein